MYILPQEKKKFTRLTIVSFIYLHIYKIIEREKCMDFPFTTKWTISIYIVDIYFEGEKKKNKRGNDFRWLCSKYFLNIKKLPTTPLCFICILLLHMRQNFLYFPLLYIWARLYFLYLCEMVNKIFRYSIGCGSFGWWSAYCIYTWLWESSFHKNIYISMPPKTFFFWFS